jgi:hypothetical protein
MSDMIDIQDAAKSRFTGSTSDELRQYLTDLGETFDAGADQDTLRKMVLAAIGLVDVAGAPERAKSPRAMSAGEPIRPPYNLTANGKWGGRRMRIRLPRPQGSKLAGAEPVCWNGKAPYWIAYGEVVAIPIPIFAILTDRKDRQVVPDRIKQPDGTEEITTKWIFSDMAIQIIGVDPLTADRAGSMTEWYQEKGPDWFKKRNTRELQSICGLLEIPLTKGDVMKTSKSDEELVSDIFVFLYSHADVVERPAEEATA